MQTAPSAIVASPAPSDLRLRHLVALRMVLALWYEAELTALVAYYAAPPVDAGEALDRRMVALTAHDAIQVAYAHAMTSPHRTVTEQLRAEAETASAGATSGEGRKRARWIELVVGDAIERVEGRRGDDVALPVAT